MGAIGEFFGFEGRIGRLGYFWRCVAVVIGIVALALGGAAALMSLIRPMGLGDYEQASRWLTIAVVLLVLWSSFALASRRLRDMGLEPVHIMPLFAALWVINTVLLEPLSRLHPDSFGMLEGSWALMQAVAAIPLLFWPGRPAPAMAQVGFEPKGPTAYLDWRGSDQGAL
jgi:uncharacterized membrane protein YhaH (DUF805 family)